MGIVFSLTITLSMMATILSKKHHYNAQEINRADSFEKYTGPSGIN